MRRKPNPHMGSSFDALLDEEGLLEASKEQAIKELLAEQIRQAIQEKGLAQTAVAARMQTSRASLNRLLDPRNASVTLHTLQKAAALCGKRLRLELTDQARQMQAGLLLRLTRPAFPSPYGRKPQRS